MCPPDASCSSSRSTDGTDGSGSGTDGTQWGGKPDGIRADVSGGSWDGSKLVADG